MEQRTISVTTIWIECYQLRVNYYSRLNRWLYQALFQATSTQVLQVFHPGDL